MILYTSTVLTTQQHLLLLVFQKAFDLIVLVVLPVPVHPAGEYSRIEKEMMIFFVLMLLMLLMLQLTMLLLQWVDRRS